MPVRVSETRICPGWESDMFSQALWNPGWEPGKFDFGDLTWVKAERPDMSGKSLWNPDKVDWDLAAKELGLGRTYPVQEPDMFG
jgi:hypothetical protein